MPCPAHGSSSSSKLSCCSGIIMSACPLTLLVDVRGPVFVPTSGRCTGD